MPDVLSDEQTTIFEVVNFVCLGCIVGLFGISANIINAIIFYKQGFKNTVNIGFFGLAISDIACLTPLQWASIIFNPMFTSSGVPWYQIEVMYLTAAWPHTTCSRITSCITVYITAERYLSIALPLKVKNIITPKLATSILCGIYFVNLATLIPEYGTSYLGWRYVPAKNKTLIGILFTSTRTSVEGIVYVLHFFLGMSSFAGVIIFTTLLVMKLKQSSRWRSEVTSNTNKREAMSNKDQKIVKMIVVIASVLIACYTPGAVMSLTTFILGSEFMVRGEYTNISEAMWSIACVFQVINSSINIFFYYSMSTKYRTTFNKIIFKCLICKNTLQTT